MCRALSNHLVNVCCSRNEATYRSDIDIFVVLDSGPLNFSKVKQLRDCIEQADSTGILVNPLAVQIHFILKESLRSDEPAMKAAIAHAVSIYKDRAA